MSDMTAERIRKQVYLLTIEDLNEHPLWEFCSDEEDMDGQDETTVRLSQDDEVPGYSPGAYILACDVTFADGTTATGYIYSGSPEDGMEMTQPNVVNASGQVGFWLGWLKFVNNPKEILAKSRETLGKTSASIFPMRFVTRSHINGAPMDLVISSFMGSGDKMQPVVVTE
jgi:hypothetical protein